MILSVGPFKISWTSLKVGIVAALVVAPVNMLLVFLFRYAKPKAIKSPMQEYYEKQRQLEKIEKREQKKQMKLSKRKQSSKHASNAEPSKIPQVEGGDEGTSPEMKEVAHFTDNQQEPATNEHCAKEESKHDEESHDTDKPPTQNNEEPPKVVHIDTRAKKKKFWLPHWSIYVGYVLAFVTVLLHESF